MGLKRYLKKYLRVFKPLYNKVFWKTQSPYPDEWYNDFFSYWDDHASEFPRQADIETTNICNADCLSCLQSKMTKPRGIMSLDNFMIVADLLKKKKVRIRSFYTTGEPLLDPTLFEKYAYARHLGILASHVSLNTNVSKLTKEKFQKILDHTDNITLSFFNVGSEYERLTGGLSWEQSYRNAVDFIKYRDQNRPDYRITIGCNAVAGHDYPVVKNAFKDYNVYYIQDAELRWAGKVITGVVDRAVMFPTFRCDGHFGVLEIKWNGNIEACSYDFFEETLYANIFEDSWSEIRSKFFERWKKPFSLCAKCDYYHKYWRVKKRNFKFVEDDSWQQPFLDEGEQPQR